MLLPSVAVRSALRLQTPAQQLMWAAKQLIGAMSPSAPVAANPTAGIPAKGATKGVNKEFIELVEKNKVIDNPGDNFAYVRFWLPYDAAQFNRGVPISRCLRSLSDDIVLPNIYPVASSDPITDGSTSVTIEQYIYERASELLTNSFSDLYLDTDEWYISDYSYKQFSVVKLAITLARDKNYTGADYYGKFSAYVA
jgi:hypothetical protein